MIQILLLKSVMVRVVEYIKTLRVLGGWTKGKESRTSRKSQECERGLNKGPSANTGVRALGRRYR